MQHYTYFVSYNYRKNDGKFRPGNATLTIDRAIENDYAQIHDIQEKIKQDYKFKEVVLNNFILISFHVQPEQKEE